MKPSEKSITKAEFKALYFQHATAKSGWTQEYWDRFFEDKMEQYFVYLSDIEEHFRMFIRSDGNKHTIFLLT